jgi:hypothetical protein
LTLQDSTTPLASSFGSTSIGLYTGSSSEQTLLQDLGTVANPAKALRLKTKIDKTVGPNSRF